MKLNPFLLFYAAIVLGVILINVRWDGSGRSTFWQDATAFHWLRR